MKKSIAFIGAGRMAEALISGFTAAGTCSDITVSDIDAARVEYICKTYGVRAAACNADAAASADIVVLAVKPDKVGQALDETGVAIRGKVLLSIAAGWSVEQLRRRAPGARIVRVMPNTPALAGKGVFVISGEHDLDAAELSHIANVLSSVGQVELLDDILMDAATALTGSGPAYVFLFAQALADAAVREGIPRNAALRMTAGLLSGSAAMLNNGDSHPALLKDAVMSPGGTTAEAVYALEQGGFRAAVMNAVHIAAQKSKYIHKDND